MTSSIFDDLYFCSSNSLLNSISSSIKIITFYINHSSLLINAGTPVNTISKLVGNSSPEITWKVYSHLYPQTINSAVVNLENLIKSSNKVQTENKKALEIGQISVKYGAAEI